MSAASPLAERRRILLVDDVELNRVLTEAVLRSATYEVDSVSDGASAIAALEGNRYDLVLMDLEMPGLDGHAAAAEIRRREIETGRGVKLAALSAKNGDVVRLRSSEVGMAAHIARPIAPHELLRQIERVFCQPEPAPQVQDPWQRERYDEWVARLGAERMHGVLAALLDQFRNLLMLLTAGTDDEALHRRAHDAASTAGMLGFADVTRCCRALLEAPDAAAEGPARDGLSDTLTRAMARLDQHFSSNRGAEAA